MVRDIMQSLDRYHPATIAQAKMPCAQADNLGSVPDTTRDVIVNHTIVIHNSGMYFGIKVELRHQ